MYIKESVYKLVAILLIIIFAGFMILSILFFKKKITMATGPSQEVVQSNTLDFDFDTYNSILKKNQ